MRLLGQSVTWFDWAMWSAIVGAVAWLVWELGRTIFGTDVWKRRR